MKLYFYLVILIFMIFIIYDGFNKTIKYAPNKIKLICSGIFTLLIFRYISLIVMFFVSNIGYLYFFKPVYFLNLISIPLSALVTLYILIRNDKIKFSIMFLIAGVLGAIYTYLIYKLPIRISISNLCGYYMEFINRNIVYIPYTILNLVFIILILVFCFNRIKKLGRILVLVSSGLVIIEAILIVIGFGFFEQIVVSDILWIFTLNYSIGKFKKSVR